MIKIFFILVLLLNVSCRKENELELYEINMKLGTYSGNKTQVTFITFGDTITNVELTSFTLSYNISLKEYIFKEDNGFIEANIPKNDFLDNYYKYQYPHSSAYYTLSIDDMDSIYYVYRSYNSASFSWGELNFSGVKKI